MVTIETIICNSGIWSGDRLLNMSINVVGRHQVTAMASRLNLKIRPANQMH